MGVSSLRYYNTMKGKQQQTRTNFFGLITLLQIMWGEKDVALCSTNWDVSKVTKPPRNPQIL